MAIRCPKCEFENPADTRFCGNCAAPLGSPPDTPLSKTMTVQRSREALAGGRIVAGKYRIVEPIGKGGMGVVYKAEDIKLERTVALKFLPGELTEESEARERFVREAKAAAALSHNHICDIHEIGEEENQLFIVMECIDGESLKQRISKGALDQAEVLNIAIQVAEGLGEAHKKGIVHRDIKPGNIMVTNEGAAKVMDFGLAKPLGKSLITKEAKTMGTVAYMSPEQAQGLSVDHRTDIWSLGVVIYEMLVGQLPFKGEYEQSIIHSILNREPEPITRIRKDLPMGLERVISKTLEKSPADRYQSMGELLEDLKATAEGLKPLRAKARLFRGRILGIKKIYAYAGLAGLVVLFALAMILLFPKRGQAYDSIAVLPLVNQSGNSDQDYFSDGVHTELIMELSRIRSIKVINKTSTMVYKGTNRRTSEIAKELGVSALVDGSVRYGGNRIRISVELIDGRTDKNLWAGNFDGENRDALTLQSEAALALAKQIQATLTPGETKALARKRSVNPDAYDVYLKGKYLMSGLALYSTVPDQAQYEKCLEYFEQAVKLDPDFALGYAGMALAYDYLGSKFGPAKALFPRATEAALKALSLDDSLPDPLLVLADVKFAYDWDREGGIKEFLRIFEIYPNHALAHTWYAGNIIGLGRMEETIFHAERARELDPLNYTIADFVPTAYLYARRYGEAVNLAKEIVGRFPDDPAAHAKLSICCLWAGLFEEAKVEQQKAVELGAKDPFWTVRYMALSGQKSEAKKHLDDILEKTKETTYHPGPLAQLFGLVGDSDRALEMLEKLYEMKSASTLGWIYIMPQFDSIRSDPRFSALARKMDLEKYWINK